MKTANATLRGRAESMWVRLQPRWDSLLQSAISGWESLEGAVLLGDDGLSETPKTRGLGRARIRWNHYVERLPFLPHDVDEIANSCEYRWPMTSNRIERLAVSWLRASLIDRVSPAAFRSGVEHLLDSIGLDRMAIEEAIRNPVELLKIAYQQLQALPKRSDDGFGRAAFWLVLFGCAAEELRYPDCEFCFRHALHGHRYCFAHSQSTAFKGTRAQKARRYYLGRATARRLGWDRRKPVIKAHTEYDMPNLIARHLWCTSSQGERDLLNDIRKQLADSPTVRQLIGEPIPRGNAALEALLRDKLDPLELSLRAWPEKITLAERWLLCEFHQAPGVRGMSQALSAKIKRAERLADQGMTISKIAIVLGCSPATIRSWCSRERAPGLSRILSARSHSK